MISSTFLQDYSLYLFKRRHLEKERDKKEKDKGERRKRNAEREEKKN